MLILIKDSYTLIFFDNLFIFNIDIENININFDFINLVNNMLYQVTLSHVNSYVILDSYITSIVTSKV